MPQEGHERLTESQRRTLASLAASSTPWLPIGPALTTPACLVTDDEHKRLTALGGTYQI